MEHSGKSNAGTLVRSTSIIHKEMNQSPAQLQKRTDVNNVVAALAAVVTEVVDTLKRAIEAIQEKMTMNLAVVQRN